jgi:hypothetical protein
MELDKPTKGVDFFRDTPARYLGTYVYYGLLLQFCFVLIIIIVFVYARPMLTPCLIF